MWKERFEARGKRKLNKKKQSGNFQDAQFSSAGHGEGAILTNLKIGERFSAVNTYIIEK